MKNLSVIYEPKGAAREYAELAVNLGLGCVHGCKYCYVPQTLRITPEEFHASPRIRKDILKKLEKDAQILAGDPREILLCFACDPYQTAEMAAITHGALEILGEHKLKATVLTKNTSIAHRDFPVLEKYKFRFGVSLVWGRDSGQDKQWEPGASSAIDREFTIAYAKKLFGLQTWISMEPVIEPEEAIRVIRDMHYYVDEWRIGKINHMPEIEKAVDWGKFCRDVKDLMEKVGGRYKFKSSLAPFAEGK